MPPMTKKAEAEHDDSLHASTYDARAGAAALADRLRQISDTRSFRLGVPSQATLTPDGKTALFLRSAARDPKQSLFEMDVASGAVRPLLSPEALLAGPETLTAEERVRRERMRVTTTGFTSIDLSHDGAKVLVSLGGRLFVFDRASRKSQELATGEGAIDPHFSPDGSRVAYVKDDDVHAIAAAAGARPTRITRGGSDKLTHGLAEFVAAEELQRHRGFWWSPDGSAHVMYEQANLADVEVLSIADPAHPEQPPQRIAYPRAGRTNADVRFGIAPSGGGATTWIEWDRARFPYVAQAQWPEGGPPLLFVLDRLQRTGQLLAVDAATGKTTLLVEERDAAWVNIDASVPKWLAKSKQLIWSSERSGEWQLELRDARGKLLRELLPKGFGYVSLADVDEDKRTAVVVASADPTQTRAWLVSLDGGAPPKPLGPEGRVASVKFGTGHDAYVTSEAALDAMPRVWVRSVDGAVVREIPSEAEAPRVVPAVELSEAGPDGMKVAIVRPRGFVAGRKYAVVDAAYGGPHFSVVDRSAASFVRAQWMADATGAIVVAIDARGTPRRGREWERAISRKLAEVPVEGHAAALRALGDKYGEMDLSRVGVYGWSFGGYFALMAVLTRPDVYRAGVAGAPVGDWREYDTAYTERFMGLPDEERDAYDAASPLVHGRKPAGEGHAPPPLLVVHGVADDNVWFSNTLKLADALERARRPFELMPLSGTTHMLLDPELNEAVWMRTADFLREALK